jgi:hypothetical protein
LSKISPPKKKPSPSNRPEAATTVAQKMAKIGLREDWAFADAL